MHDLNCDEKELIFKYRSIKPHARERVHLVLDVLYETRKITYLDDYKRGIRY